MRSSSHTRPRERGAVLVVALIMLAVMTLLVISMLKTAVIELKIGGVSQVAALNLANAEIAINNFIAANNGRFAPNFLALAPGAGGPINTPPAVNGGAVVVAATQLACGDWAGFNTQMGALTLQAVQFDIRATATGTLGGTTVAHQGVQSLAPPGSCL